MVIGNLTRKERVFDILADIRDLHTIQDEDERIQQLESIAESIEELRENRLTEQFQVHNIIEICRNFHKSEMHFAITEEIDRLHTYMQQSLLSKTIR